MTTYFWELEQAEITLDPATEHLLGTGAGYSNRRLGKYLHWRSGGLLHHLRPRQYFHRRLGWHEQHHRHQQLVLRRQRGHRWNRHANNIAFGAMTGANNSNGNYNIYLGSPGQNAESNTIRIGASNQQNFAYMAGIFGNSPSGALPVVINANGQLGTSAGSGVTSWNGRTGAVVPQTGDYSFSMISGSLTSPCSAAHWPAPNSAEHTAMR